MIRKAHAGDIDRVAEIYEAIHASEERGELTVGWARGVYPVRETARAAVERGDLFVSERAGRVEAAAILNQIQVPEYAQCTWKYSAPPEQVMVLHTLVVDPAAQAGGLGTELVAFYEQYARAQGCPYLRMDTQAKNTLARSFYRKLGFWEAGMVSCTFNNIPGVKLVCLEKKL